MVSTGDKRYAVYEAIQQLVGKRLARSKVKLEDEIEFLTGVDRAKLLFKPEDALAAMEVWESVSRLDALEETWPAADGPERTACSITYS
jgi:hypothetical protein